LIDFVSYLLSGKAKKGYNVAIVALARKILCILDHLLMNREMYEAYGTKKKVEIHLDETGESAGMSIEDKVRYVIKAGYDVKKKSGMGE
jgi:hypothetical protein